MDRNLSEDLIQKFASLITHCQCAHNAIWPTYDYIKNVELSDKIKELVQQSKKYFQKCLEQWRNQEPLTDIEITYEIARYFMETASHKDRIVRYRQTDAELAIENLEKAAEMFRKTSLKLKETEKLDPQLTKCDEFVKKAYELFVQGNHYILHVDDIIRHPFPRTGHYKEEEVNKFACMMEEKLHRNNLFFIEQTSACIQEIEVLFQMSECIKRIKELLQKSHSNGNVEKQSPHDEIFYLLDCCKAEGVFEHCGFKDSRHEKYLEVIDREEERSVDIRDHGIETVLFHLKLREAIDRQKCTESGLKVSDYDKEKVKEYIFHPMIAGKYATCAACLSDLTCWATIYELPCGHKYDEICFQFHFTMQNKSACLTCGYHFKDMISRVDVESATHGDASACCSSVSVP